jgi:hypothetical protein
MDERDPLKPERVTITVTASATHPDVMSVQDAMRQVLDFFDLLTPESDETFLWNLKLATTNSPLTVEGEPYSTASPMDAIRVAYEQKSAIEESFRALSAGRAPKRRLTTKRREAIKRIFHRNMNGIGKTEIVLLKREAPVYVTPAIAEISVKALALEEGNAFQSLLLKDRARSEIGSVEGTLIEVGSDYHAPAVLIRERNSGQEIWCRVSADVRGRISEQTNFNDVWSHSRVIVRGRIRYNSDGSISRVWAHDLSTLKPRVVETSEIADPDFTSGDTIHDYLERLREGDIG